MIVPPPFIVPGIVLSITAMPSVPTFPHRLIALNRVSNDLLEGKAKAMVVLSSRIEAVRWKKAIDGYIKSQGYGLGTLVAFSGEVNDPESSDEPVNEGTASLNPDLKGRDIRDAFAGAGFHLLLVANKFQTGFDQPLLCGMYVDRRLAGIQAVQTLSRLNRAHPGKDTTYVLDFVNSGVGDRWAFHVTSVDIPRAHSDSRNQFNKSFNFCLTCSPETPPV